MCLQLTKNNAKIRVTTICKIEFEMPRLSMLVVLVIEIAVLATYCDILPDVLLLRVELFSVLEATFFSGRDFNVGQTKCSTGKSRTLEPLGGLGVEQSLDP